MLSLRYNTLCIAFLEVGMARPLSFYRIHSSGVEYVSHWIIKSSNLGLNIPTFLLLHTVTLPCLLRRFCTKYWKKQTKAVLRILLEELNGLMVSLLVMCQNSPILQYECGISPILHLREKISHAVSLFMRRS